MTLPAQTPPHTLPFNAGPLIEPADTATIRAHVKHLKNTGRVPTTTSVRTLVLLVIICVFAFSTLAGLFSTFVRVVGNLVNRETPGGWSTALQFAPSLIFMLLVGAIGFVVTRATYRRRAERWYRLDRFAQANGMIWHPLVDSPPLPGMIFHEGHDRKATDLVRGTQPRFVEFGNYEYTTGSGKNQTTHHWGYVAVKLSTPLPNIVLDAVSNNGLFGSNLPAAFSKDQRLSLEGDFDKHFALYCPAGYESDALYLFTPDIMARFIDHAAALDVEIVDDWMFLYAKRKFSTLDPATWAWLFSVVAALLGKFAQWERWRDDRLAAQHPVIGGTDVPVVGGAGAALVGGDGAPLGLDASGVGVGAPGAGAAGAAGVAGVAGGGPLPFSAPSTSLRPPPGVASQGQRLRRGVPWKPIIIVGSIVLIFVLGQVGLFGGVLASMLR